MPRCGEEIIGTLAHIAPLQIHIIIEDNMSMDRSDVSFRLHEALPKKMSLNSSEAQPRMNKDSFFGKAKCNLKNNEAPLLRFTLCP
jgi:hypothetical protein